ncbi:class IV lanthionine synthetase LanL [Actinomadura roseirufa]|uniref:class IV lanthionine synthetase LanL n=1 Tax=Actinomadura roseirufa TaxID=2094049 RepID=UPI001A955DD5|nr:class IV lanthionine synthetase LanL [Actinomadura roseirufa]
MAEFHFSIFSPASAADAGDGRLVDVVRGAVGPRDEPARWRISLGGPWCHVVPDGGVRRQQGWKLHVSATAASAEEVLARSLPVLLDAGSAFKLAASTDHVAALNARNTSRGHSGKFITVYPDGDEEAVRLAAELHRVTAGLPGPRILSDRPYLPGSLVHYRYGAFVEDRRITNDGFYAWMILDPDGNPVEDKRTGRYTPPSWATCPFPERPPPARRTGEEGILLGGRFAVREAIRHTNKGGVYRAVDTRTGDPVVIKEARPFVATERDGRDCRDRLRAEARVLEAVEHLALAPRPVELCTQSGHLFLAQEAIPGMTLQKWVPELIDREGWGAHLVPAVEMALQLAEAMIEAHGAGLILRDFNPNNVMVRPDGRPILIDLELALIPEDPHRGPLSAGTPAYGAPEQMAGGEPGVTADYYGLGATLCYLITGAPPYFLDEEPPARPLADRLAAWLRARTVGLESAARLIPMLTGLMDERPERRWTPARARDVLLSLDEPGPPLDSAAPPSPDERCDEAIDGIVGHLLATMEAETADRLWPASCVHGAPDPCCVQHGAAGPLGALTRYFEVTGDPRLPEALAHAARWILRRLEEDARRPSGLYFGEAGAAWAVLDAGLALHDVSLAERAVAAADRLPAAVDSPDITHGTAGIGLTALHLHARTGLARFAERAAAAADALAGTVRRGSGAVSWSTPATLESKLAGTSHHGFAHGTAGVGYFLLAAARLTGDGDHLALAVRAGETLLDAAVVTGGKAMWAAATGNEPTAPYWCHGSAGIAGFLAPLGEVTGDARFRDAAVQAARAVEENSWRAVLGQCHGLAGNGDLLLDMAALTGDDRYRELARRFARLILAAGAHRSGQMVFPDEQGEVSASWGDGSAGVLAFLLRLRHGTSRQWTAGSAPGSALTAAGPIDSGRRA